MQKTKSMLGLGLFLIMAILAEWFLTSCADKEKPLKYSTIHEAAERGDLEDVKNHLRRGTAVNAQDVYGATPLHYAAMTGQTKVAEFLIKKGANVNAVVTGQGGESVSPLGSAASGGFKDMVELLIKKGANTKKYGPNAIKLAVDAIKMFKETDKEKVPPYVDLSKVDHIGVVKVLIKKGAKPMDNTLIIAVKNGFTEISKLLIDGGSNVNSRDENGQTPLHIAAFKGEVEFVKFLIEKGADVNAKDKYGNTPLNKADPTNDRRFNATENAKRKEVTDLLRKHGARE